MNIKIGSIVEFIFAGCTWRGLVYNIQDRRCSIVVLGTDKNFIIPVELLRFVQESNL